MAASEQIIIEYIASVEGLKAQLKSMQVELRNLKDEGKKSANETEKAFKITADSINKIAKEIAASLGLAFSIGKVIQFAQQSIKAFQEAEAVARKLEFAVTRIGREGAAAFEKLTKQADRLSKITIFDDESIRKSQTLLAQFGLQSDQIEELIPQIIDLASATGQDLTQATDLAIAGINGQGRALKPYGILLDDTGSKTENLNILMDGLAKFTGSAGEAFNTSAGQAKAFDNQVNELQESIGEKLAPALQKLQVGFLSGFNTQLTIFSQSIKVIRDKFTDEVDLAKEASEDAKKKFLEEDAQSTEDAIKTNLGKTQKGLDEEEAARKKARDERAAAEKEHQDLLNSIRFDPEEVELDARRSFQAEIDAQKEADEEKLKLNKELIEKSDQRAKEAREKRAKEELEAAKELAQQKADIEAASLDLFIQFSNALFEFENSRDQEILNQKEDNAQKEKDLIQEKVNFGILTEEQGAEAIKNVDKSLEEEKKKAATEQANRDKNQALFNIAIDTAVAIVKSLPNIPLSIVMGVLGAIQAGVVASRPIPKFAKGVIDLQGGERGKDSIPALLMPGESVMTAQETARHKDLLQSIRDKNLDSYLLENFITPKLSKVLKEKTTADNMTDGMRYNFKFPDEYALNRVMRRNKGVAIENADYLAYRIASELSKNNIKRTWS